MYYNRRISGSLSKLLEEDGKLRWLFDFVKNHKELDFLIGKNNSEEWVSIYRGTTCLLKIGQNVHNPQFITINAHDKYKSISSKLYGNKDIDCCFQTEIEDLISEIDLNTQFDRYYKNKKEGYYQNNFSRKYGICGSPDDDFVIIDKEVVIGYANQNEKDLIFGNIRSKYKQLQEEISILNPKRYGRDLEKKSLGNELDFLALDKDGNILLIEYKHGTNTSGIYLSPLQIGMYYEIFTTYPKKELECAVFDMLAQKQKIGLINPNWIAPTQIKDIIPVLIISEYNCKSSAKTKFNEIMQFVKNQKGIGFLNNLKTYNYHIDKGLSSW